MRSGDVLSVIEVLEGAGVRYWVDGGWGVDALLGEETRPHSDLDLVVLRSQAGLAEGSLVALGFVHAPEVVPGLPARFVLRRRQEQVDLHLIVMDSSENGWQELDGNAWGLYPAEGLRAEGKIGGRRVSCITPELQLRHHLGFAWKDEHVQDMSLLAARFGLPLPPSSAGA